MVRNITSPEGIGSESRCRRVSIIKSSRSTWSRIRSGRRMSCGDLGYEKWQAHTMRYEFEEENLKK